MFIRRRTNKTKFGAMTESYQVLETYRENGVGFLTKLMVGGYCISTDWKKKTDCRVNILYGHYF